MAKKAGGAKQAAAAKVRTVFVVNPSGTVHEVNVEHARALLDERRVGYRRGYRLATDAEKEAYTAAGGYQTWETPVAAPYALPASLQDTDDE